MRRGLRLPEAAARRLDFVHVPPDPDLMGGHSRSLDDGEKTAMDDGKMRHIEEVVDKLRLIVRWDVDAGGMGAEEHGDAHAAAFRRAGSVFAFEA